MKISVHRLIGFLLLGFLAVSAIAIYNIFNNMSITSTHVTNDRSPVDNCRVIRHELGETCVPLKPQRIVALNPDVNLDPLIALCIKPVGYTIYNFKGKEVIPGVSLDDVKEATNVGNAEQPSLEKIVMLQPDLILATKYNEYKLLSAIAPTVLVPLPNSDKPKDEAFFRENLRYVAKIFGEEAKAEEIIARYQKRIEELQQRLGKQLKQIEVSVIYYTQGLIYTPARNYDATADVLIDLGLRYKLPPPGVTFSIESIDEYNTDILFIINLERQPLSFFLQHPIFSRLKAFKNNRAYLVPPESWDTRGISGANKILDDLFKYLVDKP
jgi:iron complex transport system substrate-binding protein